MLVGAAVVPVLVGVVVVLGVDVGLVAGATEPAVLVDGAMGAVSVPVPAVSEPHPSKASAITVQALTLRKPFVWPI